jgi:hypothetical protein
MCILEDIYVRISYKFIRTDFVKKQYGFSVSYNAEVEDWKQIKCWSTVGGDLVPGAVIVDLNDGTFAQGNSALCFVLSETYKNRALKRRHVTKVEPQNAFP